MKAFSNVRVVPPAAAWLPLAGCLCLWMSLSQWGGAESPPGPEAERGISREATSMTIDYARKWAVVVGCDYKGHANPRSVPPLKSAEADAKAIYEQLVKNYGFEADRTCHLLLGSAADESHRATRDRILATLRDVVGRCNAETDGSEAKHCLLFFFAGHGSGFRSGRAAYGKLYPADVTLDVARPDESVMGNTLFIPQLVEYIEGCHAFHKLMILDCCESGLLFEEFKLATDVPAERAIGRTVARTDFSMAALVGMTAGTQAERVKDTTDLLPGHSPFTGALLRGLGSAIGEPAAGPFSATELYVHVAREIERHNVDRPQAAVAQRPQIGKLPAGMAGDFFFIPRSDFKAATAAPHQESLLLAGLGGLTGSPWQRQWPWFTPAVRMALPAIDQSLVSEGSSLAGRLRRELGLAPDAVLSDAPPDRLMAALWAVIDVYRIKTAPNTPDWRDFVALASEQLSTAEKAGTLEALLSRMAIPPAATDLHLAAILEAELGHPAEAEGHITAAIERYSALGDRAVAQPLLSLCHLDAAQLLFESGQWSEAIQNCEQARKLAGELPGTEYLHLEATCLQASALRKRGQHAAAERLFSGAVAGQVRSIQSRGALLHPMVASAIERHAWCLMDQWRLEEAALLFAQSVKLRAEAAAVADASTGKLVQELNRLHSQHGLAMIARFRSAQDSEGPIAMRMYADIVKACDALLPRPVFEEVMILERGVNSRERLADALLLSTGPDGRRWERAAAEYGQAIRRERFRLRKSSGQAPRSSLPRLHLKASIALFLAGRHQEARREQEAAAALLDAAGREAAPLPPDRVVPVLAACAEMLADVQAGHDQVLLAVRELTQTDPSGGTRATREELDVALFAAALVVWRRPAGTPRPTADGSLDTLVDLLESFNELGELRIPLGRYLRRYHDVVIAGRAGEQGPDAAADLLAAIRTARGLPPFGDPAENTAGLVLHRYADGDGWVAVCSPPLSVSSEGPQVFVSREALPAAHKGDDIARFPPELLAVVSAAAPGAEVVVDWADHVLGLRNSDFPFLLPSGWSLTPDQQPSRDGQDAP